MKEEDILRKKLSANDTPFKVPDNYFENLTSQIMDQLPEKKAVPQAPKPTRWQRIKPLFYMAAMFVGAAMIIKVANFEMNKNTIEQIDDYELAVAEDRYINEMVNESMMDDYSLYVYLTSSEYEYN